MELKGAIFDLDGTLLDSMPAWRTLSGRYVRSKGCEPEEGLDTKLYPMSMLEAAEYLRCQYQLDLPVEEIVRENNEIIEKFYAREVELKVGAREMLAQLDARGVKMCIATASERNLVTAALGRLGVLDYFINISTCGELGCGKNTPEIFRHALAALGTSRANTVVFEDALHALRTAKADGFFVAAIYDESERTGLVRQEADWYLNDWSEWEVLTK